MLFYNKKLKIVLNDVFISSNDSDDVKTTNKN